jgi:hypothetical protein
MRSSSSHTSPSLTYAGLVCEHTTSSSFIHCCKVANHILNHQAAKLIIYSIDVKNNATEAGKQEYHQLCMHGSVRSHL